MKGKSKKSKGNKCRKSVRSNVHKVEKEYGDWNASTGSAQVWNMAKLIGLRVSGNSILRA